MTAIDMVFIIWIACMLLYVAGELVVSAFKTNDYAILRCLVVCGVLSVVTLLAMDLLTGVHRSHAIVDSESRTYAFTDVTPIVIQQDVIYIKEINQVFSNCTLNTIGDNKYLIVQRVYRIVPPSWISQNSYTEFVGHVIYLPQGSTRTTTNRLSHIP